MNTRVYGEQPFKIAVIHGGPGAPGYMAPVARELSKGLGVIEPIQTESSLCGQVDELYSQITHYCDEPIVILGSSWGATLALFFAAKYPEVLSKVILSGSCVYDAVSSEKIKEIRWERMSEKNREIFLDRQKKLEDAATTLRNKLFSELANCYIPGETYDPLTQDLELIDCQPDINTSVWRDFKKLRDEPGKLSSIFSNIKLPVVNIHGDYDPHILEGIQPFLESCLENIKLYELKNCGHYPWIERQAKEHFFKILQDEIDLVNVN